ncbi:gamma-glutamylcyclotransferase family protein [Pseudomaricurvus albidus]|uniref:gamma-glutamylcyclotransferase family protein n=1 Tax=Pseudomaricurvus albidus TaxID=2842452 RepID=UPI0034E1B42F
MNLFCVFIIFIDNRGVSLSEYYFAYGSNMNAERMNDRGLRFKRALSGTIEGLGLAFNKRAADAPHRSYANVVYAPQSRVEGVLYQLDCPREIIKMDPFEGSPRLYSREIYSVSTAEGPIAAWVYVANRAMISDNLMPERWYLEHLLAGKPYLTEGYYNELLQTLCCDEVENIDQLIKGSQEAVGSLSEV